MEKLISIPELFKKSFNWYKPRIWTMLLLSLLGCVASLVIFAVFGITGVATLVAARGMTAFSLWALLMSLIGALFIIIVSLWVQVALIYTVKDENAKVGVKKVLMAAKGRLASYYWIMFLRSIIILAGFIFFIIPGIIFSIWFSLSQYVFVFEGLVGMKALKRSKELIKGYWWPVVGRLLILAIIGMLVSSISKVGFVINMLFTMPFGIIYLYMIYEDLKRIKSL